MSSLSDSGEPALLQLRKWGQVRPKLSDFHQFLISPTRELLLFLSHQSDALLISLLKDRFCEVVQKPITSKFSSAGKADPCFLDSAEKCAQPAIYLGTETSNTFLHGGRSLLDQPAVLCNVRSVAWSHCGDAYNRNGESAFRDILVVSSGNGIYIHAFSEIGTRCHKIHSLPKTDFVHGKWVVWGPTFEDSYECHGVSVAKTSQDGYDGIKISDSEGSSVPVEFSGLAGSSASKNWFRSFLIDMDFFRATGDFVFRFPEKSSLPPSAEVVSFNIFESILQLLEPCTRNAERACENVLESSEWNPAFEDSNSNSIHTISDTEDHTLKPETRKDNVAGSAHGLYKCSRVFSSTSDHYVGLLLTDDAPHHVSEEHITHLKTIVVILTVSLWGMQWTCSVDLQESCSELSPLLEWVDFQFIKGLLVCLNVSGLVYIWDAKSGDAVLHIDVLQNSFVPVKPNSQLVERASSVKGISSPMKEGNMGEYPQANEFCVKRVFAGCHVQPKRVFRKLLFTSQSLSLAAVDEYGVIYSIGPEELLLANMYKENNDFRGVISPFQHLGFGMLAGWKAASSGIGHQKVFSDFILDQSLNSFTNLDGKISRLINTTEVEPRKKRRLNIQSKEEHMDSYPSGFSVHSRVNGSQICHYTAAGSTRRVFLPIDKYSTEDAISFSPFGITRLVRINKKETKIVHIGLQAATSAYDDSFLSEWVSSFSKERSLGFEAIGCCFEGFLYIVTDEGLFVILPSLSISSGAIVTTSIEYCQTNTIQACQKETLYARDGFRPWQIEVLDRTLLYEGPDEADYVCWENGWDLKIARMRRMELGLYYLRFDEIERSLEKLADVILAEEGMLRLLLTSAYKIFSKVGSESEVAIASRLLTLAASFATKMIQRYGLIEFEEDYSTSGYDNGPNTFNMQQIPIETNISRRLEEMSHYLEVIRNLQQRLSLKSRKSMVDGGDGLNLVEMSICNDGTFVPDTVSLVVVGPSEAENQEEKTISSWDSTTGGINQLSLSIIEKSVDGGIGEFDLPIAKNAVQGRRLIPWENSRDMITRWELGNLDLKTVVEDALNSGRIPLAVLQLHLQHQREMVTEEKPRDSFSEVCDIGRAIVYDLFLKGESGLAIATLQKLGEEIETSLRQLLFGALRRSIRTQVMEEMKRCGYLKPHELKKLEGLSLIERHYPSSSFWGTYFERQRQSLEVPLTSSSSEEQQLLMRLDMWIDCSIKCDEIDGVVIGSWRNISKGPDFRMTGEDIARAGYWVCAAIWSDSWDQTTIDRIVLDQPLTLGVHIPWESQFEYHVAHNNWDEIEKLLDIIPSEILVDGILRIDLDCIYPDSYSNGEKNTCFPTYAHSSPNLEPDFVNIPDVKILKLSGASICSSWVKILLEQELAKRFIFLKEYWESTAEIMPLLAQAGLIYDNSTQGAIDKLEKKSSDSQVLETDIHSHRDTSEALHRLVIHYCVQYALPHLLDLYLDHHKLVCDNDSLSSLEESAGRCQWAKWLLFSKVIGREYDASFANARSILPNHAIQHDSLTLLDVDERICTVDDMAKGGGEKMALATLMYAPVPIQKCLFWGSVNRNSRSSFQCTLENLQTGLQKFPTLWSTLVSACTGHDSDANPTSMNNQSVLSRSLSPDYLKWRDNVFSSAGGDTSLVQMLPFWLPKPIRRLVKLFVQGPLGWHTSAEAKPAGEALPLRESAYINTKKSALFNGVSCEASIDKSIKEELYSSLEDNTFAIEHHLHRSRALGVFSHLLGLRARKYKSMHGHQQVSGGSMPFLTNVQADVQALLEPLTEDEGPVISSVMPLAIMNFENSALVATCAFLLELFGLSTSMLRVDISALQRISSYDKTMRNSVHFNHVISTDTAFHSFSQEGGQTASLARALADNYQRLIDLGILHHKDSPVPIESCKQPPGTLVTVLQHLEKASLPSLDNGKTCGSWLKNGSGDGTEFRSQQEADSKHWSLVPEFCRMHRLPLSTKYLALLAKDNDWVGFLTEAQLGGFPIDTVIQVASKEFSDLRLRLHILTVLRSMQSMRKKTNSPTSSTSTRKFSEMSFAENSSITPVELFSLVADCEKQKNPGEVLLQRAKDLRWSLLAMIASCFPDVSPLSCLTVWLEITAARETSSIKVNDISSQIVRNIRAAVKSTNALSINSKSVSFHYNRRNPKRRQYLESESRDCSAVSPSNIPDPSICPGVTVAEVTTAEKEILIGANEETNFFRDPEEALLSLSNMVAVLCEQQLFLPLLRAFDMFLPSCSLLPFVRFLQAFSQMRLSEASAHLASFSARIREEPYHLNLNAARDGKIGAPWISTTAVKAANAVLSTCPSAYEKKCLLQLLDAANFGDGGAATTCFRREYWKVNVADPLLCNDNDVCLGNEVLDDASVLMALERSGKWEQARNWAKLMESSGETGRSSVHHVTEMQAEAMVAECKEFLWDVAEERTALWSHCQRLFVRDSLPALQAGKFFLRHAEAMEKEIPAREVHEILLLSLQWLSGTMTESSPVYPLHLLREIETRVWLLAVESESQSTTDHDHYVPSSLQNPPGGNSTSVIEHTATIIAKMDNHMNTVQIRAKERSVARESNQLQPRHWLSSDASSLSAAGNSTKRRGKVSVKPSLSFMDNTHKDTETAENPSASHTNKTNSSLLRQYHVENVKIESAFLGWEERLRPAELEMAVLSLLEFGQVTAARQLQQKLSPASPPSELIIIDAALKIASILSPSTSGKISVSALDPELSSVIESYDINCRDNCDLLQVLETLTTKCSEGCGRGLCKKIVAVVKAANVLGLSFSEAFEKRPIELLQLLSLKAQDSLEEARLLVLTHTMPPASIAKILAESFLKGLLAAHRGGYMDSQNDEGPAPLLWRFCDFLKWAELCPSEQEIGHALTRLVMTGQEIPHACEVELLILSHHFYKLSACLDGVDVLVALAAKRVESYVLEGDFSCLARLVTGVSNFHALNFILGILIENGQLELLLQKYSAADPATGTTEAATGFRMAVLTALKHFSSHDLDSNAMIYSHFDMKHETASLLEFRSRQCMQQWLTRPEKERQNEALLEAMRFLIEAAEVYATVDAGQKTHRACARASLLSLQIRIPDIHWTDLSDTNARRVLVEQSRFQEALIVAEAYGLNQPSEWAPVLWNRMLRPDLIEQFVAEFVAVLPLQPSMLLELAKFYRAEVVARGDQSHFSVWLSPGGLPAEWIKHLGRSFRCLLKRTRDLRVRAQLAAVATGFNDVVEACNRILDKVPDLAGPLILRKGHGGAYLPLM
ncbi:unnamed protein product [Spirodela intermedia]|uniref:Spatacsin C-terminal domain-containing protein n=1 Tax=Spirodela intermedia TaxID=51605 RepID=A0A7I8KSR2_SPIIN|nr:unnamed protein product [Spirodela intermedia]